MPGQLVRNAVVYGTLCWTILLIISYLIAKAITS